MSSGGNTIEVLNVKLKREGSNISWGFNVQGGREFMSPLIIQKVNPNSLAEKGSIKSGDYILRIGNISTEFLTHNEARNVIVEQGNDLELTLQRNTMPRHEDYVAVFDFPQHKLMTPENLLPVEPPKPKLSPQVGVQLKDSKVLLTQSYNSPLGLYSKQNIANTLVTTIKNLNIKDNEELVDETKLVEDLMKKDPNFDRKNHLQQSFNMNNNNNQQPNYNHQDNRVYSKPEQPKPQPRIAVDPTPQTNRPAYNPPSTYAAPPAKPFSVPSNQQTGNHNAAKNYGTRNNTELNNQNASKTSPHCAKCNQFIKGPFVSALNRQWCPDHFICSNPSCGINLQTTGFIEENGQLYCEHDYEQFFAPKCAKCSKAIVGNSCFALQKNWHPDCFVCNYCNKKISSSNFQIENGLPYCVKDYNELFASKCASCKFPIEAGDQYLEALDQVYHCDCFTCTACNVKLESIGFVVKANKPYCKRHAR